MGVCRQSFYDTFGDKRRLFLRALQCYTQQAEVALAEKLGGAERAIEGLRELLREKAKQASSNNCRGCLAVNTIVEWGDADEEVAAIARGLMRRLKKTTADALRRAVSEGDLPPETDIDALADIVLFVCLGFAAMSRLRIPKAMADHVLQAILPVRVEA